jgi:hypothetical protein
MEASDFFIEVQIDTDAQTLADDAVERLATQWPGWEPNDGDPEVIQIETLAPMAENAAQTAAQVPHAIFRAYGEKLIGRPYGAGVSATGEVTFIFIDDSGYTIPQDFEIDIDGFAFAVDTETIVPVGATQVSGVSVHATLEGEDANGLTGSNIVAIGGLAGIDAITLTAPTSGGEDPEDDIDYENNLSVDLKLQAKTLVTTRDFEIWAMQSAGIGRAYAEHAGDRAVNVAVAKADGEVVAAGDKTALLADFNQYKLVNTVLTLFDPTYTTINVTYTVKAVPGFDFTDLETRIDAALASLLSPAVWGLPKGQSILLSWVNDPVVRANKLIDAIGDVDGVNYVTSVSITGSAGSASGSNWTMAGTYALPRPGVMTGTIT